LREKNTFLGYLYEMKLEILAFKYLILYSEMREARDLKKLN